MNVPLPHTVFSATGKSDAECRPAFTRLKAAAHTWEIFTCAGEGWSAMYADCNAAKHSIEMEQYIVENNRIGRQFMNLFLRKRHEGVDVRLLIDSLGSRRLLNTSRIQVLCRNGCHIRRFNRLRLPRMLRPSLWFPRAHSKVLLVDSAVAYVGSACIDERMRNWRDTQVRIEGPVIHQIAQEFDRLWKRAFWHPVRRNLAPLPSAAPESRNVEFAVSQGFARRNRIYRDLLRQIRRAKAEILLTSPYLLPSRSLIRQLEKAACRGVKVQMLTPIKSDMPFIDIAVNTLLPQLSKIGIEVYLYIPAILHAKVAVIDRKWATVGSMNMERLSLLRNREANLIIHDPSAIDALRQDFMRDCGQSEYATYEILKRYPLRYRVLGKTIAFFYRLL